jgi:hypothetical protein
MIIRNDRECKEVVIVPDDLEYKALFIEDTGIAQIYDRNGVKRKELRVPGFWDGTNDSGEMLPMGAYLVLVNGEKKLMVTIVR